MDDNDNCVTESWKAEVHTRLLVTVITVLENP